MRRIASVTGLVAFGALGFGACGSPPSSSGPDAGSPSGSSSGSDSGTGSSGSSSRAGSSSGSGGASSSGSANAGSSSGGASAGADASADAASRVDGGAGSSSSSGGAIGGVTGPYAWHNVTILGGGFVPAVVYSPAAQGLYYARTDIGGLYRWSAATSRWIPLTDALPYNQMGGESLAADPTNPDVVYAAGGMYLTSGNGVILRSADQGATWTANPIAVPMGGNSDGRSMGERLAIDPRNTSKLYFASRTLGLWQSSDAASSWSRVPAFPVTGDANLGLSFVYFDPTAAPLGGASSTIYVGVATTAAGSNLYRSVDGGASWSLVPGGPSGQMPHHAAMDSNGVLYLPYDGGPGPNGIMAGAVWKYASKTATWSNITPPSGGGGFGGLSVDAANPGTLVVSTIDWWNPDEIYRTTDGGSTWSAIGRATQHDQNGAEYLCFGPAGCKAPSASGWMGDIEIDPFDSAHVLYVTGQGVWESHNASAATPGAITWTFADQGLEETAVIDMTSSVHGALLSAVGDIGGFRHPDVTAPPPLGMYTNPVFSNTTGIDFAGSNSQVVARVGSSNGTQLGAFSADNGQTWTPFAGAPAGSSGQGAIAVTADGSTFVWAPNNSPPARSQDHGATWQAAAGLPDNAVVASDRVNQKKLYAYSGGTLYVSGDAGATFTAGAKGLGGTGRARAVFGIEGDVWVATGMALYHSTDSGMTAPAVSGVQSATAVGFGRAPSGRTYPAVFLIGTVAGTSGFFRSDDAGATFTLISDPQHQFGATSLVSGDEALFGRVYIGTNGRGIVYGDPAP